LKLSGTEGVLNIDADKLSSFEDIHVIVPLAQTIIHQKKIKLPNSFISPASRFSGQIDSQDSLIFRESLLTEAFLFIYL
jgi:hypothetical protein